MTRPAVHHHIVLAHPDPRSFCASVAKRWIERAEHHHQTCRFHDLYAEGFDPVLKSNERPGLEGYAPSPELIAEFDRLQASDVIIFVYPMWFGSPPAMMKGYLERVLGKAKAFMGDEPGEKPLKGIRLVQISTSSGRSSWLAEKGVESALNTLFDRYLSDVLGVERSYRLHLDNITDDMPEDRGQLRLALVDETAARVCADANAARWKQAQER